MLKKLFLPLILVFAATGASGQFMFRTEYIGRSAHKDKDNVKTGGRGDARVMSGSLQLPFSYKPTDDGRMYAWGFSLNSSYTYFSQNEAMKQLSPGRIFDNRIGVLHLRPFREKWSMIATVGAGIYAAHTNLGRTRFDEVLFDGALLFVWHIRHNLDVGFGAAFNSSFGYPMGFPAIYLKWNTSGRFFVDLQMMDGAELTAGVKLHDRFSLSLVTDFNGAVAMEKIDGKKMMFSHSYITVSLQPEIHIGKHISIPLRFGMSANRDAYYEERTLRAFFKAYGRDYNPHFLPALYGSAALKLTF